MTTYTLIVLLSFPSWWPEPPQRLILGTDLSRGECLAAAARAELQLPATLSRARLVGTKCERAVAI